MSPDLMGQRMATITRQEQQAKREDWLAWRRQGLGGSDAAPLLGLSPWTSRWALWAEKVGLVDSEDNETERMEFGRRAEVMVGPWFEDVTGLYLVGEQTQCTHPAHPWMRCTVDAFVKEGPLVGELRYTERGPVLLDNCIAVAEIKTTISSPREWEDEIPAHYVAQATHIAAVTGFRTVFFPTLHLAFGRPQFRVHRLDVTDEDVAWLVEQEAAFWHDHIVAGNPPEVDGSDATTTALSRAWRGDNDLSGPIDHLADTVARWDELKEQLGAVETELAHVTNELKAYMGEATVATIGGRPAFTWRSSDRRDLDRDGLRAEAPELVARHTHVNSVRRFLRVAAKEK